MLLKTAHIFAITLIVCLISGCSSQQLYATSQDYQRNECFKLPDRSASNECLGKADKSYDEYQQDLGKTSKQ